MPDSRAKKPERLQSGDKIAVIAPAGPIDPLALQKGVARLKKLGFEVLLPPTASRPFRYLAGTDAERLEEIHWAFSSGARAIIAARGGYGTARIVDLLNFRQLLKKRTILIGCSDLTTLLLRFHKAGLPVCHGPMVSYFARSEDPLSDSFFLSMLTSREPMGKISFSRVEVLREGIGEGRLVGGCLSLVSASIGTSYEIQTRGKVLFLEDVNEPPYRIDRMLTHLKLAGKFQGVKGVLFGQMVKCDPPEGSGYSLKEVIDSVLETAKVPVLYGLPFGHGDQNITLPYGLKVRVESRNASVTFLESPVR
ncbi:MAG TPA: LD-carboxypeptidase [Nitrospiria bacterium]|nr:LD-carboxypeptidase [Nitrospiria bacterium]